MRSHSSDFSFLQDAVAGVGLVSVWTCHLRILRHQNHRAQTLSTHRNTEGSLNYCMTIQNNKCHYVSATAAHSLSSSLAEAVETLSEQDSLARIKLHIADPALHSLWVRNQILSVHLHQTCIVLSAFCFSGLQTKKEQLLELKKQTWIGIHR